jgi:hypothetical protein
MCLGFAVREWPMGNGSACAADALQGLLRGAVHRLLPWHRSCQACESLPFC